MIANINTIFYVLSVSEEIINSGTVQRGTAISRIDDDDGFQIYKYSNFLTSPNNDNHDSNENLEARPFKEENMYLIWGKFSVMQDNSINVTIITSAHIPLDKDDIPAMKPTVHLLGKTMSHAQLSEAGYSLEVQVKPYLSKEQFKPFLVNLTHPQNGRFKNALVKAKKGSTIHTTGLFFFADSKLYCEVLEFQFVSAAKTEAESSISVPWKSKTESRTGSSSSTPKSAIDRRIDLVRQSEATKAPSSTDVSTNVSTQHQKKDKHKSGPFSLKISEISKSQQDQAITIRDSEEEKDVEDVEDKEENEDDDDTLTIARRKPKRRKLRK
jgi:hypothetical protein